MAGRVDLFIPPPPMSDRRQALDFHLAVRNFFAWLCRRSVVGEHLGSALVGLMGSMIEFRSPGVNNTEDILSYLDEEGYLNMANQPIHALAMLRLAESFQIRQLYINAFAHCAGMADCLYMLPEYQVSSSLLVHVKKLPTNKLQSLTSLTRTLLRRAQADVENKLGEAGRMLRNFLEDDLSESNLGLSAGGRAHLERFRTFLHAFYTHRMGYYPPSPIYMRSDMWEPAIYQRMRDDFEALYDLLADKSFTTIDNGLYLGQGGICALQNVHTFDLRHKFKSLPHPLPLLPEIETSRQSKRTTLFGKGGSKLKPDQRLVAHAALVKATNAGSHGISRNALVAAYKRFEEESVLPANKLDKNEKLSQVDARKIRWILVYCIYQTLRSCTEPPPEVLDTQDITYSVAISMADLPPWKEAPRRSASKAPSAKFSILSSAPSLPSTSASSAATPSTPGTTPATTPGLSIEIKPDVDYFALTHRDGSRPITSAQGPIIPPRSGSLSKAFSRSRSLRKSMERLKIRAVAPPIEPAPPSRRSVIYHEIIVRGYGNGTQEAQEIAVPGDEAPEIVIPTSLAHSPSTASTPSTESSTNASLETPCSEDSWASGDIPELTEQIEKMVAECHERRLSGSSSIYSVPDEICPPVPRRNSARKSLLFCDEDGELAFNNPDEWHAIEADVEQRCEMIPVQNRRSWMDAEMIPNWDDFADVGGLKLPSVRE